MVDAFDPYHRWLGIPPDERPATHYRLLGIVPFEDDPEVIRDGAERQMAHVRKYALGPRAAISQQILNELAAAKACLMDPERKASYDEKLRSESAPAASPDVVLPPAAPPPAPPQSPPPPVVAPAPPIAPVAQKAVARKAAKPNRAPSPAAEAPVPPPATPAMQTSTASADDEAALPVATAVGDVAVAMAVREPSPRARWLIPLLAGLALGVGAVVATVFFLVHSDDASSDVPLEFAGLVPQTIRANEELVYAIALARPDVWQGQVQFKLLPGPAGATLDPNTGQLRFKPAYSGAYTLEFEARTRDNALAATGHLPVTVAEPEPVKPVARRPRLLPVPEMTAQEGLPLRVDVATEPLDMAAGPVAYRLSPQAPAGASIDPQTGVVTWVPLSSQAGRKHRLEVEAVVGGDERLTDRLAILVDVRGVHRGPVLFPLYQQSITADEPATVRAVAEDSNNPPRPLKFSLINAPEWAKIDPQTGVITCLADDRHANNSFIFTVRVAVEGGEPLFDEKPLTVFVRRGRLPAAFTLSFPSGRTLTSSQFQQESNAGREADALRAKTRAGSNDVAGLYYEEKTQKVKMICAVRNTTLDGPAVFYYPSKTLREFVTYDNGRWDGLLAHWAADGNRQMWSWYDKGQRDGLCCLFREDRPYVVLETAKGKTQAVHLIAGTRIARTFDDPDLAAQDPVVGPALKEIESLEAELRKEDRETRREIELGINRRLGAMNAERRAAANARSAARKAVEQKQMDEVRRGTRGF